MSTVWLPRPANAETRLCRNDINCHFLKNGHCWYYHPPHHHAHNQRMNNRSVPNSTANRSNNNPFAPPSNPFLPSASSFNPSVNPFVPTAPINNNVNVFDSQRNPSRNNHSNGPSRNQIRNSRRRRNQRQNRSNHTSHDRSPSNQVSSDNNIHAAPVIDPPNSKRKRQEEIVTSSSDSSTSDSKQEITIEAFQCPISMEIMSDPVVAADGHSYDRLCIEQWLRSNNRSPMNNTVLQTKKLIPNYTLKKCILEWNNIKPTLLPLV